MSLFSKPSACDIYFCMMIFFPTFVDNNVLVSLTLHSCSEYCFDDFSFQCSNEMLQILRLARRDGDEWVRLFASVLAPFPNNQTISVDQITEGGLEGLQEEIGNACE